MFKIEIENHCLRELKKLDKTIIKRAFRLIEEVIAKEPYSGKKLKGKYSGLYETMLYDMHNI